ncbi:MAG: WYL domain-containing protein [Bacteriovoracaceae bacterium]|nr:WYL domain-containing protein [Bacteriovoracaceae bacterium]
MPKDTKKDRTKPWEDYLNVLSAILKSSRLELSQKKLFDIIGKSRSQNYKILNNLLNGTATTDAILVEIRERGGVVAGDSGDLGSIANDDKVSYKLKSNSWEDANNISLEGKFFLECYKHVGYLLDSDYSRAQFEDDLDITSNQLNKLKRKFFYLAKVQAKAYNKNQRVIFEKLVKALLNETQILLNYPINDPIKAKKGRSIKPYTLCQYRDDLYLLGEEEQKDGSWIQKNFKVSRIKDLFESAEKFTYPSQNKWNPNEQFKLTSGLINSTPKEARVLVHGHFKQLLLEKNFCNARLMSSTEEEEHEYIFTYTEANEFIGQLFTYAECVEILEPKSLREQFIAKAERALSLNYGGEVLSKFRNITKKKAS